MKVILSFLLEEGDRTLAMSNEHFGQGKRSVTAKSKGRATPNSQRDWCWFGRDRTLQPILSEITVAQASCL